MRYIIAFILFFYSFLGIAQKRIKIQDYATIVALQAETSTPQSNDKVYIVALDEIFRWDATSVLAQNSADVIQQTNIATGRWLKLKSNKDANYVLAANVSVTSNVRANVAGWVLTMTAGKSYRISIIANFQTVAAGTGISLGFVTPSGTATILGDCKIALVQAAANTQLTQVIRAISASNVLAGSFLTSTGVNPANSPHFMNADLILQCTANGTFQVQLGSEINGNAATLLAGSTMTITTLN